MNYEVAEKTGMGDVKAMALRFHYGNDTVDWEFCCCWWWWWLYGWICCCRLTEIKWDGYPGG